MRRVFYILALSLAVFSSASCDKWRFHVYQPESPSVFVVNQNTDRLEVGPETQEQIVYIATDMLWDAKLKDGSWCRMVQQGIYNQYTSTLTIRVEDNVSNEPRIDSLIVFSGNQRRAVAIYQLGLDALLSLKEVNLPGIVPVQARVTAKSIWAATTSDNWFTIDPDHGTTGSIVTITAVDENLDVDDRDGFLTITTGGVSLKVPVFQKKTDTFIVSATEVTVEGAGGQFVLHTRTNVEYQVNVDVPWISFQPAKALLEFDESFFAQPNPETEARTGHIIFTWGDVTETVTVTQKPKDAMLAIDVPGVYGIAGKDYVYMKRVCQRSTSINNSGFRTYRILYPYEEAVAEVSGVPMALTGGDSFKVTVSICRAGQVLYRNPLNVMVVGESEDFIWLRSSESTYMVLRKR